MHIVDDLLQVLVPATNGARVLEEARALYATDRYFTFARFSETAHHMSARLREAGLSDVELLLAPADGASVYGDWVMPLSWEVDGATLDIVFPDGSVERVADRSTTPTCLAMWSAPTPYDGVEAPIVWLDDPAQLEGRLGAKVRGKILFTSAEPRLIRRRALESGAVGFLSDFQRPWMKLPHAVYWQNVWSDDPCGWAFTRCDTPAWSFHIAPYQGNRLRARLREGHGLRGRATVRSRLGEGTLPVVTARIRGVSDEEVVLVAHLFEPGAVDNAAGAAIVLEAGRLLQSMIEGRRLPLPRRSLRLLFPFECYGTLFWAETQRRRRVVAGLCVDAVCGIPELAAMPLEVSLNPHWQMSFSDALLLAIVGRVMEREPSYLWQEVPCDLSTDNIIADSQIGIPCPWIRGLSRTHHTSADVPGLLDSRALGLVATITAAYAYFVAAADGRLAPDLARLAAARAKSSLTVLCDAERETRDLDDSMLQLLYLAHRHAEAVASVLRLLPEAAEGEAGRCVGSLRREVLGFGQEAAASLANLVGRPGHVPRARQPDPESERIFVRRLLAGPITLDRLALGEREGRPGTRWSQPLAAILGWCDGTHSLGEAYRLAARELRVDRTLSPVELTQAIDPNADSALSYFDFLRRHGYVAW